MSTETYNYDSKEKKVYCHSRGGDAVYGLGFVGAAIYFIGHAATFWLIVLGIFKPLFGRSFWFMLP